MSTTTTPAGLWLLLAHDEDTGGPTIPVGAAAIGPDGATYADLLAVDAAIGWAEWLWECTDSITPTPDELVALLERANGITMGVMKLEGLEPGEPIQLAVLGVIDALLVRGR